MNDVKTIKILHLTFDMRIGGTEQVIVNLINTNQSSNIVNSVLCIESPVGPFGACLIEQGIQVDAFKRTPGFDNKLIKNIRQYLKEHSIDILHCHQYTPWVYGVIAAIGLKVKVIFTEHGRFYPDSGSWKRKLINPVLMKFTDYATCISIATKRALIEFENISANKIDVIYNGILELADKDIMPVKPETIGVSESESIILGTIARLDPIKNQTMMLHAFKYALEQVPNLYLVIVGDGEERQKLELLAQELNLHQRVIFTGYITKPVNYLKLMDIFLLSSLSEGTSMTLLEAMSLGKPCIVTDAGGNPEIIENKVNGLVTPNDDAKLFAQAIVELASDPEMMQKMASSARSLFVEKFESKIMVEQFHSVYKKLMEESNAS
ncbi:glycosyltransferase [Catenovulum sp. 2E275]|uniref:glycosyltransferase n=1 Tax=Catenovulum sp. 2E275 TaxID=2980497 RepID=UPI0021D17A9C|nr:glycosyltransferase [Catenovulum sp. 2E275]MCU4675555.1 glycosyltransferase [Catenovulum sp. 2E275]